MRGRGYVVGPFADVAIVVDAAAVAVFGWVFGSYIVHNLVAPVVGWWLA